MFVIKNCRLIPELTEGFDRQMADVVVDGKYISGDSCRLGYRFR